MSHEELHALANGRRMGLLVRDRRRDTLRFDYDPAWAADNEAFPLSLSMPLVARSHPDAIVEPFLWGLLPDNESVLRRWGEQFGVSPRHAFKLITHVGEDCAGAVQFVPQARAEALLASRPTGRVQWLKEDELAERLQLLLRDHSASRLGSDLGRFSLAGAQPKTALFHDPERDRWGVPSGAKPTTHILKPATGQFDGFAENEHFCLSLARTLGMPAARSEIRRFGAVPVFVTERYDRVRTGTRVLRVHQEDASQALARMRHTKYQNEGGPSPADIAHLIRRHGSAPDEDVRRFADALLLNWLLLGTDAHAKNYSLLLAARGEVRLAPLYDLASALPYPQQMPPRTLKSAMKIGGEYRLRAIGGTHWRRAAAEIGMPAPELRARMANLAADVPEAVSQVQARIREQGLYHPVIPRLAAAIGERAAAVKVLAGKAWG